MEWVGQIIGVVVALGVIYFVYTKYQAKKNRPASTSASSRPRKPKTTHDSK